MNKLDTDIVSLLIRDGRMSFAEIARRLGVTRAHVRDRVQVLQETGVIEQFTAVINPEKLGKSVSAYLDIKVAPQGVEEVAGYLGELPEVASLYVMSDMRSLHVHTLTDSHERLHEFVRRHVYSQAQLTSVESQTLLSRVKNRRGGPRL